ncbi:hypothetical protein DdX_14875 [Ditylenchus destructor]|uniref:Uncharacterized protein n=1 Tax=Ditylenchus destructor TaxID=166010 RepID=A0AAD4R1H5_9BILA|nr:hypothetical protein DdX_14875 [Ditylenchus destructor]
MERKIDISCIDDSDLASSADSNNNFPPTIGRQISRETYKESTSNYRGSNHGNSKPNLPYEVVLVYSRSKRSKTREIKVLSPAGLVNLSKLYRNGGRLSDHTQNL